MRALVRRDWNETDLRDMAGVSHDVFAVATTPHPLPFEMLIKRLFWLLLRAMKEKQTIIFLLFINLKRSLTEN